MPRVAPLIAALALVTASAGAQGTNVPEWMARVGARVEAYFLRAESLLCEETVRIVPLGYDLLPNGDHVRELVYELRVTWDQAPAGSTQGAATVQRQLLTVDGRRPRPGEEPGCFDRDPVSPEPLAMFLPARQPEYVFTWKGPGREGGRTTVTLEYKPARVGRAEVVWRGDCLSIELPGRTRGRVWLDASTADILRLDEELAGRVEVPVARRPGKPRTPASFTVERADQSTIYRPVVFQDPDETLVLPASIVSLQVIGNSGTPRVRTYQTFSRVPPLPDWRSNRAVVRMNAHGCAWGIQGFRTAADEKYEGCQMPLSITPVPDLFPTPLVAEPQSPADRQRTREEAEHRRHAHPHPDAPAEEPAAPTAAEPDAVAPIGTLIDVRA